MLIPDTFLLTLPLGLFLGLVLGLTGAGGAILATPLLMATLHLDIKSAMPISLVAVFLATSIGALWGLWQGIVRYKAALLMSWVGMVMTPVGMGISGLLPTWPLTLIFMGVLLIIAKRAFAQAASTTNDDSVHQSAPCLLNPETGRFIWTTPCAWRLISVGGMAGFLGGLLGVGGGFVIIPALQRFTNAPQKIIIATSFMIIALSSLSGAITALQVGRLDGSIAIPFALAAIFGLMIGKWLSNHIPPARLHQAFGIVVILAFFMMGLRLWLS